MTSKRDSVTQMPESIYCRPTLVLDAVRAKRNIARMAQRASSHGIRFRPHFKTHQSREVGRWFRPSGVTAITVSSLDMAIYFAEDGWDDILVAFPANPLEIAKIRTLSESCSLHLITDSVPVINSIGQSINSSLTFWIDVDIGYQRTGVNWNDLESILRLRAAIAQHSHLRFGGLLTHSGHTYRESGIEGVGRVHRESIERLCAAREALQERCDLSVGDTPSCVTQEDWTGISEMRPGNFIFFDLMQLLHGVCTEDDIAAAVACPIAGVYPSRNQLVLMGGGVHLAKESIADRDGTMTFGFLTNPLSNGLGWGPIDYEARITSTSQEHGIAVCSPESLQRYSPGTVTYVIPVHSCMTVDLYSEYFLTTGEVITKRTSNCRRHV